MIAVPRLSSLPPAGIFYLDRTRAACGGDLRARSRSIECKYPLSKGGVSHLTGGLA